MPREIKFRAWENNSMRYDFWQRCDLGNYLNSKGVFKNIIVMQYTGLKDKNNKEIYEGDILEWENAYIIPQHGFVEWNTEYGWWGINNLPSSAMATSMKQSKSTFAVIGDIYSTPNLLESK